MRDKIYDGIDKDKYGGMTPIGGIIKDAWLFGLIPETETCAGWTTSQLDRLHQEVGKAWEQYGILVSQLPPELRERHQRIHDEAIRRARELGWNPDVDISDES